MALWAVTRFFHSFLSDALTRASSRDLHLILPLSCSTILLRVVFGLPLFLRLFGAQVIAMLQFTLPILPRHVTNHLLGPFFNSLLNGLIFALLGTSSSLMRSCQLIFRIRLKHLWWKIFIALSSPLFIFQVSEPYSKTDSTGQRFI